MALPSDPGGGSGTAPAPGSPVPGMEGWVFDATGYPVRAPAAPTGITYTQYTAPEGPYGSTFPAGTLYSIGSNGSVSRDYTPSTGGGSGAVSVSLNPDSTSAWSVRTIGGRDYFVNELTREVIPLEVPGGTSTGSFNPIYPNDRNGDGLDDTTGLANGVQAVAFSVSPSGYAYNGIPTNRQGRELTQAELAAAGFGGSSSTEPKLTSIGGKPYVWDATKGQFVPAPVQGGGTVQPTTYGGGGSYSLPRDYIGEANAKAQGQIAVAQAQAAAQQDKDAAQAALQRQLLEMQQGFTGEQNAISRAMQAQQLAQQAAFQDAQLRDQYEAAQKDLIDPYRESLRDYDARAVWDQMRRFGGNAANVLNANQEGQLLTDNAMAGSAALFEAMNKPYQPINSGVDWSKWGLQVSPTGQIIPAGAPTGGLATGGTPTTETPAGGTPAAGGTPTPEGGGLATSIPMSPSESMFQSAQAGWQTAYGTPPGPEEIARMYNVAYGILPPFSPLVTGNYSGVWQSIDPSAPNYKPPYKGYEIPGYTYDYDQMGLVPNASAPVNTQLTVPGLASGEQPVPPQMLSVPGLATGGLAKGAFIVGDRPDGRPTGHEEMVIAPGGAQVIPLGRNDAGRMMRGGLSRFATGTNPYAADSGSPFAGMDWWSLQQSQDPIYSYPQPEPIVQPYVPPPTTSYVPQPAPTTSSTTGGSVPTTVVSPPVSSTPPPPVVTTTPTTVTQPATQPTTTAPTTNPVAQPAPTGGLAMNGTPTITPEQQALIEQIRQTRLGTADMAMNPYDVAFGLLSPLEQDMFFRNEAQRTGLPQGIYGWDVARNRLAGVSGGLAGKLGY